MFRVRADRVKGGIEMITGVVTALSGRLMSVIDIFDHEKNDMIGWSSCSHHSDRLEIEEFFIRPDYRFRGHGNQMVEEILNLSKHYHLPLKLWADEADSERDNLYVVKKIAKRLGLNLAPSIAPWAGYEGV
jgi:GNAT superfamily N-acetyltransferase